MKSKVVRELVLIVGFSLITSLAAYFIVERIRVKTYYELSETEYTEAYQSQKWEGSTDSFPNGVNHVFFSYDFWRLVFNGNFLDAFHYKDMDQVGQHYDSKGKIRFLQITPVGMTELIAIDKTSNRDNLLSDSFKLGHDYFSRRKIRVVIETFLFTLLLVVVVRIGSIVIARGRILPK